MTTPLTSLLSSWQAGRTLRKHTMHVLRNENIAEHTWGVILVLLRYWPDISRIALVAAHLHDAGEHATADIPAPLCWDMPELKSAIEVREHEAVRAMMPAAVGALLEEVTPVEWQLIEIADRAEFVLSCTHEWLMGNKLVEVPIQRAYGKLKEVVASLPESDTLELGVKNRAVQLRNELATMLIHKLGWETV